MKKTIKDFATFIRLHDGMGKPKINFQDMYKMFPQFTFESARNFGQYKNFGKAFEQKIYDMIVTDEEGNTCYMTYREYQDANENLAYCS